MLFPVFPGLDPVLHNGLWTTREFSTFLWRVGYLGVSGISADNETAGRPMGDPLCTKTWVETNATWWS